MKYSISEIIDLAVGIEEAGEDFYQQCSERADEPASDLFRRLALEEHRHRDLLRELGKSKQCRECALDEDYHLYLRSVGSGMVFPDAEAFLNSLKRNFDTVKAVDYAIQTEKNSLLLYLELHSNLSAADDAAIIRRIIEEERKHIQLLSTLVV